MFLPKHKAAVIDAKIIVIPSGNKNKNDTTYISESYKNKLIGIMSIV